MADATQQVRAAAAEVFGGRRVVCAGGVLAGMHPVVDELRAVGAERIFLMPTTVGTGPLPAGDDLEVLMLEPEHSVHPTEQFRAEERLFADPPAEPVAAIRRFAGDAPLVLGVPFAAVQAFGPFPVFGRRRLAWVALEDKTRADALFDDAGVRRPPSCVVPVDQHALDDAVARLDQGAGTVWAGDAREGFNGGADYVRWVRDQESRTTAMEFFAARCDRVRVAPFVEGVPCSIHGFVTDEHIAVFRPVELMTMRVEEPHGLRYAGAATYYDPPPETRAVMRAAAAGVGAWLRAQVDFRGAFTVDGIAAADGWLATECNPRGGAGLGYLNGVLPDFPFGLSQRLVIEGRLPGFDAAAFEEVVVPGADAQRWGGAWTITEVARSETTTTPIAGDEHGYRVVDAEPDADAAIMLGPAESGSLVRFTPDPERTPVGPSLAPRVAAAFACADAELGAGVGPVAPAVSFP